MDRKSPFADFDDAVVVDAGCCCGCVGGGPGTDGYGFVVGSAVVVVGAGWAGEEEGCGCWVGGDDGGDEGLAVRVEHEEIEDC